MRPEYNFSHVQLEGGKDRGPTAFAEVTHHPAVVTDANLTVRTVQPSAQVLFDLVLHPANGGDENGLRAEV